MSTRNVFIAFMLSWPGFAAAEPAKAPQSASASAAAAERQSGNGATQAVTPASADKSLADKSESGKSDGRAAAAPAATAPTAATAAKAGSTAEAAKPAAQAQETAPATPETEKEGVVLLGQALDAASNGAFAETAQLAYGAITKIPQSSEKHEGAELALADALAALGFEQAASEYYLSVIERRQRPDLLPRALVGIERLSRRGVVAEEKLLRGVLVEAELRTVPPDVADFLHYFRGLANLRLGNTRWTNHDFTALRRKEHYGHKARLAQAVAFVRNEKPHEAMSLVEALLSESPGREVEREARLIRARLLFEEGKNQDALVEFRKVDETGSASGGEVLLEQAWSFYHSGRYHDAMGLLYALGAPAHKDLFLPEQYVLRGLIYQRFCHFRAAKSAATDFTERYGAAISELRAGAEPETVKPVAQAAEILPGVASALRIHRAVLAEKALLADKGSAFGDLLVRHMNEVYGSLEKRASWESGRALVSGATEVAERLLEAQEQANLLAYEVGISIHRRVHDAAGKAYIRAPPQIVPTGGDYIYYPFNGEFWSDELPDMRFLIQDRCVE